MNHIGTQNIIIKNFLLRPFKIKDAKPMFLNWASDEKVTKFLTWPSHKNIDVTKKIISNWLSNYSNKKTYNWAICFKDNPNEPIGSFSFEITPDETAIMGYCLSRSYWHQNIMSVISKEMIFYMRNIVGIKRFLAEVEVGNIYSEKIFIKNGFQYFGEQERFLPLKNKSIRVKHYILYL